MDNSFFNFSASPFENNLDQRFLFLSEAHKEVLAALLYFIQTPKGIAMVCGDVGTGKTMLINAFLEKLPETVKPIVISTPHVNFLDLLSYLAKRLEIKKPGGNVQQLMEEIKNALMALMIQDQQAVLIIDEAHLLSNQGLEEIRLLSNLETPNQKLMHILLVGQYALSYKLERPEMQHLRTRININRFLPHLNSTETIQYIDYRLQQVDSNFAAVFDDNCQAPIFKMTKGIPRLINQLCDDALMISMTEGRPKVSRKTLKKAAQAMQGQGSFTPRSSSGEAGSRWGRYAKVLFPAGIGLALGLIGIIALIMLGKFQPIAHVIESEGQTLLATKPRPQTTEMKAARAPSPGKALVTQKARKLSPNTPGGGPFQVLEKEIPAKTPPSPGLELTPASTKGTEEGLPEVKQKGSPLPHKPEVAKTEEKTETIPPAGTTPKNKEEVAFKKPEPLSAPGGETSVKETLPTAPVFEQYVARGGESLTRIAARHYPEDPLLGIAALILQNPQVTKVDVIRPGEVLYFPKINVENRTIQLKDNLWYVFYGRYSSPERVNKIASWFTSSKIKFSEGDIKNGAGSTIRRIFIGGYATEEELTQARNSLTAKTK